MSGFLRGIAAPVVVGVVNRHQQMQSAARVTGNLIVNRYVAASQASPQTAATRQAKADAAQQWQTFNSMASHLNRQLDELMTEQTEGLDDYFEGDLAVDIAKGQLKELTKFGGKAAIDLARAAANDVRLRMMHHPSTSEDQRAAAVIQYLLGKVALEAPRAGDAEE